MNVTQNVFHVVIDYGYEVTDVRKTSNFVNVDNCAVRGFLGVHKFRPITTMYLELGWARGNVR